MPLPKPRADEEHDAFIARCHSALADEFGDQDQRHAVCETQWRAKHGGEAPKAMTHDRASIPFELKALDSDERSFTGLASTWDVDLQNDRIEPGAFKRTIDHWMRAGKPLKLLNSHKKERCEDVIGEIKSMEETKEGLLVSAKMADTPQGNAVWNLIKSRLVDGLSIGYSATKHRNETKDEGGRKKSIRVLEEIKLFEISAVVFGANPNAVVMAAKSLVQDAETWAKDQDGEPEPEAEPEPTPKPEPTPDPEPEEEPEPTPEEEVLASLEAQLDTLMDKKETAIVCEDFFEADLLKTKIEGLESRIQRQKRRIQSMKGDQESWAVDGKARLETEALLAKMLARAS
jgi:HK97 family phage prohead protease